MPPQQAGYGLDGRSGSSSAVVLIGAVVVVACILALWFLSTPIISRPVNNLGKSQNNLKMIGQAIGQYCMKFHGVFPDSFRTLFVEENMSSFDFINGASNDSPATGPTTKAIADQLVAGGHLSYAYVGRGLNAASVKPDTVVAYEILPRPTDGGNILFADGHAEWFDHAHFVAKTSRLATRPASGPSQ